MGFYRQLKHVFKRAKKSEKTLPFCYFLLASRLLHNTIKSNGKFSPAKAVCSTQVTYCGYQISTGASHIFNILPSASTIKELITFAALSTKKQLQSLLGVINCLKKNVPLMVKMTVEMKKLI